MNPRVPKNSVVSNNSTHRSKRSTSDTTSRFLTLPYVRQSNYNELPTHPKGYTEQINLKATRLIAKQIASRHRTKTSGVQKRNLKSKTLRGSNTSSIPHREYSTTSLHGDDPSLDTATLRHPPNQSRNRSSSRVKDNIDLYEHIIAKKETELERQRRKKKKAHPKKRSLSISNEDQPYRVQCVKEWIERCTEEHIPGELLSSLTDGKLLLKLLNNISNQKRISIRSDPYRNVEAFLRACVAHGMDQGRLFLPKDLINKENPGLVIGALFYVANYTQSRDTFSAPALRVRVFPKSNEEHSDAISKRTRLAKTESQLQTKTYNDMPDSIIKSSSLASFSTKYSRKNSQ